jgi:hypothetical protein
MDIEKEEIPVMMIELDLDFFAIRKRREQGKE